MSWEVFAVLKMLGRNLGNGARVEWLRMEEGILSICESPIYWLPIM